MENVHIAPVRHKDTPCGMGDTRNEERVQCEDTVDEYLDPGEVTRDAQVVDVDLQAKDSVQCPVKTLCEKLQDISSGDVGTYDKFVTHERTQYGLEINDILRQDAIRQYNMCAVWHCSHEVALGGEQESRKYGRCRGHNLSAVAA